MRVALIDYGAGNLRSAAKALLAAGADAVDVTADATVVAAADRIVLPGVGAFGACMAGLSALPGMVEPLDRLVPVGGRPFLGICVGMQLMADAGEEHGRHQGLGWIRGTVRRLAAEGVRVPHMGWNRVEPVPGALVQPGDAYFVHSYALDGADPADVAATASHGIRFPAAVQRGSMLGVQFHPEKSQGYGLHLLARFLAWRP